MKQRIAARVYCLAEKQGIYQTTVHDIISSYINYCKVLLMSGRKLNIFGLAMIVPDVVVDDYVNTLSYDCLVVAEKMGLPSYTVFTVIREYISSLLDDIVAGRNAEIRGLVTFKPLRSENEDRVTKVHANMSVSFKELVNNSDCVISSARVHTYKLLRDSLKAGKAV